MGKPVYHYPDFVKDVKLKTTVGKLYWIQVKIAENKTEGITVILKNPSRANQDISDKTIYNVASYIYQNRERFKALKDIGVITILNLMPNYFTDSSQLHAFKKSIIDAENIRTLQEYCAKDKRVIIAWGNHPKRLYTEYETLKQLTMRILAENKNEVLFVDKLTLAGNPKHGQVWGYGDALRIMN